MRIWHPNLYPYLCRKHLLACWREGLGCLSILLYDKKGYRKHPQVVMYEDDIASLLQDLVLLKKEMDRRGYETRDIIENYDMQMAYEDRVIDQMVSRKLKVWQSLKEQKETLKTKDCDCYHSIKTRREEYDNLL